LKGNDGTKGSLTLSNATTNQKIEIDDSSLTFKSPTNTNSWTMGLSTDNLNNLSITQNGITTGSLNLNSDKLLVKGQAGTAGTGVFTNSNPGGSINWFDQASIGNVVTGSNPLGNYTYPIAYTTNLPNGKIGFETLAALELTTSGVYIIFVSVPFTLKDQTIDFYTNIIEDDTLSGITTILFEDRLFNQKNYTTGETKKYTININCLYVKTSSTKVYISLEIKFLILLKNGSNAFIGNWAAASIRALRIR
jgi:hypothetical protein